MNQGKQIEEPACVIKNAIELAPVDVKIDNSGKRLAASSMDGSLKVYDLSDEGEATLLVDSNSMDMVQMPCDENASSQGQIDPWKLCFNPKNSQ